MKFSVVSLTVLAFGLTACGPPVPNSAPEQGVGFEGYNDFTTYRTQRDKELNGEQPTSSTVTSPNADAVTPGFIPNPDLDSDATAGEGTPPQGPVVVNNPGISDEQDFDAVSGRQTIESDAARIQRNREAREEIQPKAIPNRTSTGPNVVQYAISTSNPVGVKAYRRGVTLSSRKFEANCAKYASADLAQEAFLAAGGPQRDRMGLDPDGDGFACDWDPTIYRRISGNG